MKLTIYVTNVTISQDLGLILSNLAPLDVNLLSFFLQNNCKYFVTIHVTNVTATLHDYPCN